MENTKLRLDWRTEEKITMREGFGEGLLRVGGSERVVVLSGDLAHSTRVDKFAESYPTRFFEMGVAEQNMAGVAAGLASTGHVPFVASFAVFSPGRNWEQVRTSIAMRGLNVKILGSHGGVASGVLGPTHQATEDMALTRVLPGMTVLAPADKEQAAAAVEAAYEHEGPVYIRAARVETWQLYSDGFRFEIGKIERLREGGGVTLAACGVMVGQALLVADRLAQSGVEAEVLNVSTVKPLDVETLVISAKKTGRVVTIEDHQIEGGMGSAVAEALAQHYPVPVTRIGLDNRFGVTGPWEEVYQELGLDVESLVERVRAVLD